LDHRDRGRRHRPVHRGLRPADRPKIIIAGILTGFGVAGMHYTGMYAMRLAGHIDYNRNTVIASVVIAVVAATVALWFTVTLRRGLAITIAAGHHGCGRERHALHRHVRHERAGDHHVQAVSRHRRR
jgi:hypothetical protein